MNKNISSQYTGTSVSLCPHALSHLLLIAVLVMTAIPWYAPQRVWAAGGGNALSLDGTDDYVALGTIASAPTGDGARTVEFWLKTSDTATGSVKKVFAYGGTGQYERFSVGIENGDIGVESNNSEVVWDTAVNDGSWHHIAVSYPGSGGIGASSVYVDGTAITTEKSNWQGTQALATVNSDAYIGSLDGSSLFLDGTVDELRVWNTARSQTDIQNNKDTELVGTEAGLIAYYRLNQGTAGGTNTGLTTAPDSAGSNDGTLTNFALSGTTSNWVDGASVAKLNNALSLDGTDDYVALGTIASAPTGDGARTVEFWLKTSDTATGSVKKVFAYGGTGQYERFSVGIENGDIGVESNNSEVVWDTAVNDGSWHHIAVSYPGSGGIGASSVYVDGTKITTEKSNWQGSQALATVNSDAYIGSLDSSSLFLDGTVDELRVWNTARSQTDIQNNKDTELVGTETGLIAYYRLNQGTAGGTNTGITTAPDSAGSNDGTLTNFALSGTTSNWVDGASITTVASPPTSANSSVTTNEDTDYTFQTSDFSFSDADSDTFAGIQVVTLPAAGTLTCNSTAVIAGSDCGDVTTLVFTPNADEAGDPYTTFTFKVKDSSGAYSSSSYDMSITVTSVNDPPTSANSSVSTEKNTDYTFQTTDFPFTDVDTGDTFAGIQVVTPPAAGTLTCNSTAVIAGSDCGDVTTLVFTPNADEAGDPYTSFTFEVKDSSGAYSSGSYQMSITVTEVNTSPTSANGSVTTNENTGYTFQTSDFSFNDADSDTFAGIQVVTLPAAGTLTCNSTR